MIVISYGTMALIAVLLWIGIRFYLNFKKDKTDWRWEFRLLTILFSALLVLRVSFFPWAAEGGNIQPLVFNAHKLLPMRLNILPFVHMFDSAETVQKALVGNILLAMPFGLALVYCFEKYRSWKKIVLTGLIAAASTELLQLFFYNAVTDIDDLITLTIGITAGYGVYLLILRIIRLIADRKKPADEKPAYEEISDDDLTEI